MLCCIVLYWWGDHCCTMHCNLFKIYCDPPNVNMPIKVCSEAYLFQAWGSLMSLKFQIWDPQLKVPHGGLVLRIFTSWKKSIEPWISRRAHYPETTETYAMSINFQMSVKKIPANDSVWKLVFIWHTHTVCAIKISCIYMLARACLTTADVNSTCPQTEMKDHTTSLVVTCEK